MKVLKFGGTSVTDAIAWRQVIAILKDSQPCIVVVSATAKTTNNLLEAAREAKSGNYARALEISETIKERHLSIIEELIPEADDQLRNEACKIRLNEHLAMLNNYLLGISTLGELTPRSLDIILCIGEQISSYLITHFASLSGLDAIFIDSRSIIKTNSEFGKALPLVKQIATSSDILTKHLKAGKMPIMGGFYGSNSTGETTTLGRGGSDYTASLVGSALHADGIEIWTDVSGMFTSDPRYVEGVKPIEEITFDEAAELAYFGARVLHPATIQPAIEQNIPVYIKNTFRPSDKGTKICQSAKLDGPLRAIAFKKGITIVTVSSSRMLLAYGFLAKVFTIFENYKIPVDLISTSEVSISMSVDSKENLDSALEELQEFGKVVQRDNMALICVVGQKFLKASGIAGRIFKVIEHVSIQLISQGSSDINLSFVVNDTSAYEVVTLLHNEFFISNLAK